MIRGDGTPTSTIGETAELLLGSFFPSETEPYKLQCEGPLEDYPDEIDEQRVKAAIWRMNPSKAPGSDGINAAILRKAWPIKTSHSYFAPAYKKPPSQGSGAGLNWLLYQNPIKMI